MTTANPLRLGTRRSALALAQATLVARDVALALGRPVELVEITTRGDVEPGPLTDLGGAGVFVTAVRDALLSGKIDLAVHSLKDLPATAVTPGLILAAVPLRADPRDALVHPGGLAFAQLPAGTRLGTGSPRRASQVTALNAGIEIVPIRGNVDTRIAKAVAGEVDCLLLARAGLERLGRLDAVTDVLDPDLVLPAPGQGALAVECRVDDPLEAALRSLDHADSRAAVTAERVLLAALGAGCSAPVGALAEVAGDRIWLRVAIGARLKGQLHGSVREAADLGRRLAGVMLAAGADELVRVG